jgi:hypothetical protein
MKTILRGTILVGLAAGCWTVLAAQDAAAPAGSNSAKTSGQEMSMPMPTPAPEMTKMIKMMAGSWSVSEKSYPSPMMPNGGTGKGTAKLWAGPGNMSLMEDYHSSGVMGSSFTGFGTFWWDAKGQVYRGLWCDTMTPGGCDSSGTTKWDGDKLVGMMEGDMGGQKMVTTFTYSDWKPDSFVMSMAMGPDASSLKPAMTITYTRTGTVAKMAEKP